MSTAASPSSASGAPILGDTPVRSQPAPAAPTQGAQPQGAQPTAAGQPAPAAPAAPPELPPYEHPSLEKFQKGKHRTVEDLAKAHEAAHLEMKRMQTDKMALETRLGAWAGPPKNEAGEVVDYQFKQSPESLATFGPIDVNSPEYQYVQQWGKQFGASQAAVDALFPLYENIVGGDIKGKEDAVKQSLVEHYGTAEDMSAALNSVWDYIDEKTGRSETAAIRRLLLRDPETAPLLERFIKGLDQVSLPTGVQTQGQADTRETILKMQAENPNWRQMPELAARESAWVHAEAAKRDAAMAAQRSGSVIAQIATPQRR